MEFLFHGNGVKESCNFENVLHAKCCNFANTQKIHQIFRDVGWEDLKNDTRKILLKFFKERPRKLKKVNSQYLVKQTVHDIRQNVAVVVVVRNSPWS